MLGDQSAGQRSVPAYHFRVITIVSGLPRSGTSLMMQMLAGGGIEAVTDGRRVADPDNPRGYFEDDRVKRLKTNHAWLGEAQGKAVKIVHILLRDLPTNGFEYRVIWMQRRMSEVLASQRAMLTRQGKAGAALNEAKLGGVFAAQMAEVEKWLAAQAAFRVLPVNYHELIADPSGHAAKICEFLGGSLDEAAMAQAVDASLYRQRSEGERPV